MLVERGLGLFFKLRRLSVQSHLPLRQSGPMWRMSTEMAKELASLGPSRIARCKSPCDADEPEGSKEVGVVVELLPEKLALLGKGFRVLVHSSDEGAEVPLERVEAVAEVGVDADEIGLEGVRLGG